MTPLLARIVVLTVGLSCLAGCSKPVDPPLEAEQEQTPSEVTASNPLLAEPAGLIKLLKKNPGNLRLVDTRPLSKYERGHIPGAVHVDLADWKTLAASENGLTNPEAWGEKVATLGISPEETSIIVYGENPTNVTRVWWLLRYLGVKNVAVLNGGWKGWIDHAGDIEIEDPPLTPIIPFEIDFQTNMLITLEQLKKGLEDQNVVVMDARSEEEFTTHIPDAHHLEWSELMQPDGRFKSEKELETVIEALNINKDQQVATYCRSGGRASLNMFVMEMLGYENVQNYYCSWNEWDKDESAPKESVKENE